MLQKANIMLHQSSKAVGYTYIKLGGVQQPRTATALQVGCWLYIAAVEKKITQPWYIC